MVDEVFSYIEECGRYDDKEDYIVSGKKISDEDMRLQEIMEKFAFGMLEKCIELGRYYSDESDMFENYNMYLEHNEIEIFVHILYGQGNYFYISKRDEFYRDDLIVRV